MFQKEGGGQGDKGATGGQVAGSSMRMCDPSTVICSLRSARASNCCHISYSLYFKKLKSNCKGLVLFYNVLITRQHPKQKGQPINERSYTLVVRWCATGTLAACWQCGTQRGIDLPRTYHKAALVVVKADNTGYAPWIYGKCH